MHRISICVDYVKAYLFVHRNPSFRIVNYARKIHLSSKKRLPYRKLQTFKNGESYVYRKIHNGVYRKTYAYTRINVTIRKVHLRVTQLYMCLRWYRSISTTARINSVCVFFIFFYACNPPMGKAFGPAREDIGISCNVCSIAMHHMKYSNAHNRLL